MSISVTGHSGGTGNFRSEVPRRLMDYPQFQQSIISDDNRTERAENLTALLSRFEERFEKIAHQQGIEFIPQEQEQEVEFRPQGLPNFQSLLDEFLLKLQEMK